LFQGLPVNDYDVYIQDMDVLIRAQHCAGTTTTGVDKVLDGRKREDYLNNILSSLKLTITKI
jgi:hypothetical protein